MNTEDVTMYVLNKTQTTEFDISNKVEKEVIAQREIYWHEPEKNNAYKALKNQIEYFNAEKDIRSISLCKNPYRAKTQYADVTDIKTGKQERYSSYNSFYGWMESLTVAELTNYIIEVHHLTEVAETIVKYSLEVPDFEEPTEKKKAKLYRFETFFRCGNEPIPTLTMTTDTFNRGFNKIQRCFKEGKLYKIEECVVLLNGVDITGALDHELTVGIFSQKKEDYYYSRFRAEYDGITKRISVQKQRMRMAEILFDKEPEKIEIVRDTCLSAIRELENMLAANKRLHS